MADGTIDPAVRAGDVTVALADLVTVTAPSEDRDQLHRLLDLLVRGLRP